ncbi:transporter substrate-binding domain-containing protein [Devosia sp. 2618]|uniref:transporter substrate-binding domain-containing protein n=1 Tax=Devosia sp. 2618 TaxID=3156454 RepID=UPI00339940B2
MFYKAKTSKRLIMATVLAGVGVSIAPTQAGEIFDAIQDRGVVRCGVQAAWTGFSYTDEAGSWKGFSVDICAALAAAMFGDATKVEYVAGTVGERLPKVQVGELDLAVQLSAQMSREAGMGLRFVRETFFTGQGFMFPKELGITDPEQLDGVTACIQSGTSSELQTPQFFNERGLEFESIAFDNTPAMLNAYQDGRCDVISLDQFALAGFRLGLRIPDDHIVADPIYTAVYSGPFISDRDAQWHNVVLWTINAMIQAEELGITSENVDEMRSSQNGDIRRLLGEGGDIGQLIGLQADWAYNVIKQVGNYGEVYNANLGPDTAINLTRGKNRLTDDGGLLWAPPVR